MCSKKIVVILGALCISHTLFGATDEWLPKRIESADQVQKEKTRIEREKKQTEEQLRKIADQNSEEFRDAEDKLAELEIDTETVDIAEQHFSDHDSAEFTKQYTDRLAEIDRARTNPKERAALITKAKKEISKQIDDIINQASGTGGTGGKVERTFTDRLKLRIRAYLAENLGTVYSLIGSTKKVQEFYTKAQSIYTALNDANNLSRILRTQGIYSSSLTAAIGKHTEALAILSEYVKEGTSKAERNKRLIRIADELSTTLITLIRLREQIPIRDEISREDRTNVDQSINSLYNDLNITPEYRARIEREAKAADVSFAGIRTASSNADIAKKYDAYRSKQLTDIRKNIKNTAAIQQKLTHLLEGTEALQRFFENPEHSTSEKGRADVYQGLQWTYLAVADIAATKIVELSKLPKRTAEQELTYRYFIEKFYEAERTRIFIQNKMFRLAQASPTLIAPTAIDDTEEFKKYRTHTKQAAKLAQQTIEKLRKLLGESSAKVTTPLRTMGIPDATIMHDTFTELKDQIEEARNLLVRIGATNPDTQELENQILMNLQGIIDGAVAKQQNPKLSGDELRALTDILNEAYIMQKNVKAVSASHTNQTMPVFTAADNTHHLTYQETAPVNDPHAAGLVLPLQSSEAETFQEATRNAMVTALEDAPDAFVPPAPPPPPLPIDFTPDEQKILTSIEQTPPTQPAINKSLLDQLNNIQLRKAAISAPQQEREVAATIIADAMENRRIALNPDEPLETDDDDNGWDDDNENN